MGEKTRLTGKLLVKVHYDWKMGLETWNYKGYKVPMLAPGIPRGFR
jgi:hypothetical protein